MPLFNVRFFLLNHFQGDVCIRCYKASSWKMVYQKTEILNVGILSYINKNIFWIFYFLIFYIYIALDLFPIFSNLFIYIKTYFFL